MKNLYPWRLIQTNLREIDWEDMDASSFVRDLASFDANAVLLNIGGILANYQTKIEDQPINPFLHGDTPKEIIEEAHKRGIHVIARMDFSKVRRPVYERHPDWAYRTKDGEIVDYNGNVHACINGGFQQETAFKILEEVLETFDIDGIFINMGGFTTRDYSYNYYGPCHCEACRKKFQAFSGMDLPDAEDPRDPVFRKYAEFKQSVIHAYQKKLTDRIRALRPDVWIDGTDFSRIESNTEYRRRDLLFYDSASTTRGFQALSAGRPCSNPAVDFVGFFYRHTAVSTHLTEIRLWETLQNLGMLEYYLMGRLDNHEDRTGFAAVKKVFHFAAENEALYKGLTLYGDVLLVRKGGYGASAEGRGWVRFLAEHHILFQETEPEFIRDADELMKYSVIICADAALTEEAVSALDTYTEQGGTLITSGMDPTRFKSFAGVSPSGLREDMVSALFRLSEEDHKIFRMAEDTDLFYFGDRYFEADYPAGSEKYLQLIPPHRYGPPEMCYYTEVTDQPGAVRMKHGSGQAICIPWYCGSLLLNEGHPNTELFMDGIISLLAGVSSYVENNSLTPMVDMTYARGENADLLQFVNHSGHYGNIFTAPLPIYSIRVKVPTARRPVSAKSLRTGACLDFQYKDGFTYIKTDVKDAFEALVLSYT